MPVTEPGTGVSRPSEHRPENRTEPTPDEHGEPASSLLVRAARGRQGAEVPVWFMRQAGRSLPEYRAVRAGTSMLASCRRPDLVAEITCQPVRRHGVDAAILFSDIMVPLLAAGVGVDIVAGTGPVINDPIRTAADLDRIQPLDPAAVDFVSEAVRLVRAELGAVPVIGFAGAPFTLASYLVEGGPSREYARTKAMMVGDPALWNALCGRLAQISATFLQVQVGAGVAAVQLFDSWAGSLGPSDYTAAVLPHSVAVLAAVAEVRGPSGASGVPRIHFGVGTGELLGLIKHAGAEVLGVDWRVPLGEASRRVGGSVVQGNLDPALLGAPWPVLADRVREVLRSGAEAPGHIFNLGHGVPPDTDPGVLTRIVELVHTEAPRIRSGESTR